MEEEERERRSRAEMGAVLAVAAEEVALRPTRGAFERFGAAGVDAAAAWERGDPIVCEGTAEVAAAANVVLG